MGLPFPSDDYQSGKDCHLYLCLWSQPDMIRNSVNKSGGKRERERSTSCANHRQVSDKSKTMAYLQSTIILL